MNELTQKIIISMMAALVGSVGTYFTKAVSMEGRLDGIERAVIRIEQKLK